MNGVSEFVSILETLMNRRVAQIGDLIDSTQFIEDLRTDGRGKNFTPACFQVVHNIIHDIFKSEEADGPLFESFGNASGQFAPVKRLVRSVPLDDPQIRAFDLLISGKTIFAFQTFTAAANTGTVARLA